MTKAITATTLTKLEFAILYQMYRGPMAPQVWFPGLKVSSIRNLVFGRYVDDDDDLAALFDKAVTRLRDADIVELRKVKVARQALWAYHLFLTTDGYLLIELAYARHVVVARLRRHLRQLKQAGNAQA